MNTEPPIPATPTLLGRARCRLHPWLAWGTVQVFCTPLPVPCPSPRNPAMKARLVRESELVELARAFGRSAALFKLRAAKGDRCFVTFCHGRPAHMRWVAFTPTIVPEIGAFACPGPDEAYIFDSLTLPAFRRQGAMAAERALMLQMLACEGKARAWSYILADNPASLATLLPQVELKLSIPFLRLGRSRPRLGTGLAHPLYRMGDVPLGARAALERGAAPRLAAGG